MAYLANWVYGGLCDGILRRGNCNMEGVEGKGGEEEPGSNVAFHVSLINSYSPS